VAQREERYLEALRDFERARQRASLERIAAQLTGRSDRLFSFSEVSEQLHTGEGRDAGLRQIPLDAIVGSVGRYGDFTRSFLPRRESDQERWARVRAAFQRVEEIPPITVFQVGESYFVLDGNHRVSVARSLEATHITAHVTVVESRVPLPAGMQQDELICQAQYAAFLEETALDQWRPEADLTVTAPGHYRVLKEQIRQHQDWLNREASQPVPLQAAATGWYDEMYLPVVAVIRRRGVLRYFPGRTATDLYVWIVKHQAEIAAELGWEVKADLAANSVVSRFSSDRSKLLARMRKRVRGAIMPPALSPGPPPGLWRERTVSERIELILFGDILVPMGSDGAGERALAQALVVAGREKSRLHGLHVLPQDNGGAKGRGQALAASFQERVQAAGLTGEMALERGPVSRTICSRARWTDLVVIELRHLPRPQMAGRLSSGFSRVVRRCSRPVLAVPGEPSLLQRPLLAYDGSPKAREALFVATYLSAKWELPLVVLTAGESEAAAGAILDDARFYLIARGVPATYVTAQGEPSSAIHETAEAHHCDLIVMGGYGFRPLVELVLGSTVDQVLRRRRWPVLICR
jgi:nucleotide-binding universal stress UspA family protein